jgi:hypothetical protein
VQDNEESDEDGEGAAASRRSARGRHTRLQEKEADEADALKELEESMQDRVASTGGGGTSGAVHREHAAASVSTRLKQEQLKDDELFQAMLKESRAALPVAGKGTVAPKQEEPSATVAGGWAPVGVAGGSDGSTAAAAAPSAALVAAQARSAARQALFDDGSAVDSQKDKQSAQFVLQAKAYRGRSAVAAPAAGAGAETTSTPGAKEAFIADRQQVRLPLLGLVKHTSMWVSGIISYIGRDP